MEHDARRNGKQHAHGPAHLIDKNGVSVYQDQVRPFQENAGGDIGHKPGGEQQEPELAEARPALPGKGIDKVEQRVGQIEQAAQGDMVPELVGGPKLNPHKEGAARPHHGGQDHKEVGGDDPVFLGRQEDQEQEGVAGKGDHRDIIESAHQEPLLSQNPWEESRFSISWGEGFMRGGSPYRSRQAAKAPQRRMVTCRGSMPRIFFKSL